MPRTAPDTPPERTLTPDQAVRAFSWSRLWMMLALIITQGATLGGVLWADRQNTERALQTQAQASLEQLVRVTADNVRAYLQSASQIVSINRENVRSGLLSADDPVGLSTHFLTVLDTLPQLNGMLVGHSDGRFTFVRREGPNDQRRFVRIIEVKPQRHVTTNLLDEKDRLISQSLAPDPYDPRTRPWYMQAVKAPNTLIWTDPYVFASSRLPGITVASAQSSPSGGIMVVGADVKLRNLTEFLKSVQISPNGRAFITDEAGHAIAASRAWPVSVQERVPKLSEVADPALRDLLDAQGALRLLDGAKHYRLDGTAYSAVIKPVEIQPGMRWMVGVYAPESDFTQSVQGAPRQHLLFIVLASLVSSLIAWPIVTRATRPLAALQRQATTDNLTGLRNRASFMAQLAEQLRWRAGPDAGGRHLGVAIFDLDGFKAVNDNYGHPIGDEVLHAVGARMLAAVRAGDTLGRLGGDEFALLVEGNSREEVRLRVEGVLQAVARRPVIVNGRQHDLSATAGLAFHDLSAPISSGPHINGTVPLQTTLLARADTALIRGKKREKGRVWVEGEVTMPTLFR